MELSRQTLYKFGTELEAKTCKVLLVLYGLADDEGRIDTSLKDLNERSGLSINTIRGAIQELIQTDILEVSHTVGISANYRLKH